MTRHIERRPCWDTVNDEALREPGLLARVIAATDLTPEMETQWGRLEWFPPPYVRVIIEPDRLPPLDHAIRAAVIASYTERRREEWAPLNRNLRDTTTHIMSLPGDEGRVLALETFTGSWRTFDGANRGDSLLTLCSWRWSCSYEDAGQRIASLIGIPVPQVDAPHAR